MATAKQCSHPQCGCEVSGNASYCSEACENAMSLGSDLRPEACDCAHSGCRSSAAAKRAR